MSNLIERLAGEVRQRPVLALAATGILGAVVVSRLRADDERLATLARYGQRGVAALGERANALGERAGEIAGQGAGLVEEGRERVDEATRPDSGAERVADAARESAEEAGTAVRTGAASSVERIEDFSLPDLLRELVTDRSRPSRTERVREAAASIGITEKTVSMFAATLLAKSLSGYMRWRGEQRARYQGQALSEAAGADFETRLEDHTVVELRQMAADREIEGRSAMNKDELIEALSDGG